MQIICSGNRPKPLPYAQIWRVMRLTTLLLLIFMLNVNANGFSQKVNLDLKEVTIKRVLNEIHKQTGYSFFYKSGMFKNKRWVSIKANNRELREVLAELFDANKGIEVSILNNSVVLTEKPKTATENSPTADSVEVAFINITGTVLDAGGNPMPGASVNIKGSSTGVSTDENGRFSIEIPGQTAVLVISFVGYESKEVTVNANSTSVRVQLAVKEEAGEEIVVVGYGTQRKKEVTSAVTQVSGEEILKSQSVTVSNSLSGKLPGVIINQRSSRPGADAATVSVRGISTYRNNAALIVVDGVANRDGIDRIDPNDIESFTVLKDASAAIYGAQSANGVILITTKRGKTGKPQINYSMNHGFMSPVRLVKMSDAATYAKGVNDLALQQGQALPFTEEQISQYESGELPSTNWFDEVYKSHFNQQRHSLTVSGGNEFVKYFLSGGVTAQGSILQDDKTSKYRQYNFRSNVDVQLNKQLSVGLDIAGRRQQTNFTYLDENTVYSAAVLSPPTIPARINGLPTRGRANNNPLAIATSDAYDKTQYNLINGTIRMEYKIPGVTGLSIDGFGALDYSLTARNRWQQPHYFYELNTAGDLVRLPNNNNTSLTENISQYNSYTLHGKIKYSRSFGLHDVSGFAAVERNEIRTDDLQAARVGFVSSEIDELFAGGAPNQTNNGSAFEGARLNYFGRASYGYDSKYLLQFQFRYDGSQIFADDRRFGFFPGVSAGWVISRENFMRNVSTINNLKLRASYGLLGNDRIAQFQYLNLYTLSSAAGAGYVLNGTNFNVINPGVAANPLVTWETKKSFDIGVEGALFNNKLSFELDYFYMRTQDILSKRNVSIPVYTGLNSSVLPDENIGIVDNRGFDGQVNYRTSVGRDWKINIGANMTFAKNFIVFNDEGDIYPEAYQKNEGRPVGSLLLYEAIGIYRSEADLEKFPSLNGNGVIGDAIYRDVNGDGVVNSDDRVRSEFTNSPQMQYGILFGAEYKNFDFSGNFMGQARAIVQYDYVFGAGNNTPEYWVKNAWSPSNPNGSLPRLSRGKADRGEPSTLNTRNVSFLRLKNIELGYTIPARIVNSIGIRGTRIYVNAFNLLTFDKLKNDGLGDPETINPQGWIFPQAKSINFGINVNL